jgi:hypothetical protein
MPDDELTPETTTPETVEEREPEEVEHLRSALAERDLALAAHGEANRALLGRVRAALLASEPAVVPELVTGETLEEVEASFAAAVAMVGHVREVIRQEQATTVPAGSPGRTPPAARSPFEKIRAGLGQLGR